MWRPPYQNHRGSPVRRLMPSWPAAAPRRAAACCPPGGGAGRSPAGRPAPSTPPSWSAAASEHPHRRRGAAEARGGLGPGSYAALGVAGREYYPVGVQVEGEHLVHGQQAVAVDIGNVGGRQCQGGLTETV